MTPKSEGEILILMLSNQKAIITFPTFFFFFFLKGRDFSTVWATPGDAPGLFLTQCSGATPCGYAVAGL